MLCTIEQYLSKWIIKDTVLQKDSVAKEVGSLDQTKQSFITCLLLLFHGKNSGILGSLFKKGLKISKADNRYQLHTVNGTEFKSKLNERTRLCCCCFW